MMAEKLLKSLACVVLFAFMAGCSSGGDHQDLHQYISEIKLRPAGKIEEIPQFEPYEPFVYSAAAKRSPFDRPLEIKRRILASGNSNVKPDFNRTKEYLESYDLPTIRMVGNIEKGGTLWALVSDPSGTIHWVKTGNYVGKNHGRIVETAANKIELIEIVSDGLDGWVERPRVIALSEE